MKIGIGIIGLGHMGSIFAKIIKDLPDSDCELVGVADLNEDKISEIVRGIKCEGYRDYKKLLNNSKVNLVYIASPLILI